MSEQTTRNIIGPQVRKLRYAAGLTQDLLAARCGAIGLDLSRGTLANVEAGLRCVSDREVWQFARALRVPLESLYPPTRGRKRG